jgi:hypothetical protein
MAASTIMQMAAGTARSNSSFIRSAKICGSVISYRLLLNHLGSVRDPELNQPCETGDHEQSTGGDGPAHHAAALRISHDSHHNGQRRAHWRNHIAYPVDEVQYGAFRLSSGLSPEELDRWPVVARGFWAYEVRGKNCRETMTRRLARARRCRQSPQLKTRIVLRSCDSVSGLPCRKREHRAVVNFEQPNVKDYDWVASVLKPRACFMGWAACLGNCEKPKS